MADPPALGVCAERVVLIVVGDPVLIAVGRYGGEVVCPCFAAGRIGGLCAIDGVTVYGIADPARFDQRLPTVACRLDGYTPRQVAEQLGDEGIFVWDGNYYALTVMQRLGLEDSGGAVRIGPVHYNTPAEIDRTLEVVRTLSARRAPVGSRGQV